MSPDYYWNICQSHISDTFYRILNDTDLSNVVQQRVTESTDKYKPMLTLKEYNNLTNRKHKIFNLYKLPKIYKCKRINEIIPRKLLLLKHTQLLLVLFPTPISHIRIMEPSLAMISLIAKNSFNF